MDSNGSVDSDDVCVYFPRRDFCSVRCDFLHQVSSSQDRGVPPLIFMINNLDVHLDLRLDSQNDWTGVFFSDDRSNLSLPPLYDDALR